MQTPHYRLILAMLALCAGVVLPLDARSNKDTLIRLLMVTRVLPNTDSVKVSFAPVPGAGDYRIYQADHPEKVKYAGLLHSPDPKELGHILSYPATQIEWNGLIPGKPTRLIVEAVDHLGPVPGANRLTEGSSTAPAMPPMAMDDTTAMVGSNAGRTKDGKISINGQGSPDSVPKVVARSRPVVVTATGKAALPSGPDAEQVLWDTFSSAEITTADNPTPSTEGTRTYHLHSPQADWDVVFLGSDLTHSQPFVMDRHFMDLLFDGEQEGIAHKGRSACALSPQKTVDFSGGRVLHLTMEVDGHLDGHRWMGFNLAPADDPLQDVYWSHRVQKVNRSNQSFFCEITDAKITLGVIDSANQAGISRHPGPLQSQGDVRDGMITQRLPGNGQGLDNRTRFDLFLTRSSYALYEDGKPTCTGPITGGIPFEQAKVYYSHFLYHSADEQYVLQSHSPHEHYWREQFPYSDERHWDNIGFEVLPATTDLKTLAQRAR